MNSAGSPLILAAVSVLYLPLSLNEANVILSHVLSSCETSTSSFAERTVSASRRRAANASLISGALQATVDSYGPSNQDHAQVLGSWSLLSDGDPRIHTTAPSSASYPKHGAPQIVQLTQAYLQSARARGLDRRSPTPAPPQYPVSPRSKFFEHARHHKKPVHHAGRSHRRISNMSTPGQYGYSTCDRLPFTTLTLSTSDFTPSILFNNEKAMMNTVDDRTNLDAPVWTPARVTIAALTPAKFGVLISYVKSYHGLGDSIDDDMFPVVIEPDTLVVMDEFLLCVTFTDARGGRAWPQFKLRFKESEDYWSFNEAFAKAKLSACPRQADIMDAFRKVLGAVSGRTETLVDDHLPAGRSGM
ncbi:hypothetical protein NUW54_g9428 [Trametes sanguinea]|uniref:Uncharacterized protein n=1 Tax=Trametes sanguinea TaxID=158606 RepID=A0ACC1P605_9APHY|nr:hypothetical protein NUW54_g9428 [Trametes sanguinea]